MVLIDERPAVDRTGPARERLDRRGSGMRRLRPILAPALVGLVAALYVGLGAAVPSLWYDEAATVTSATRTWPELWAELAHVDIVHGLYYAGMHVWFDLVGYSPLTLRLPSTVAVGLAAALLVATVRAAATARLAIVSGIVLPLIPRVAWAGGEGRSYALGILAAVAVSAALFIALRTGRKRWWLVYGVLAALSTLLFLYLALVLVAHAATVVWLALAHRMPRRDLLAWAVTAAAATAASLPLLLQARRQDAQLDWIKPIGPTTPHLVLSYQWFDPSWAITTGFWILLLAGVAVLLLRRSRLAAWVVPALVAPTAVLLIASAVLSPLYSPRYLTFVAPAVAIAIAAAITALPLRSARVMALVAVVALSLPVLLSDLRQPAAKQASTWSQVADLIAERRAADPVPTAILWGPVRYHPSASARVIEYSYPAAFAGTVDPTLRTPAGATGHLWERRGRLVDSLPAVRSTDTAYLITSIKHDRIPSYTETLAGIGWHPVARWTYGDVNIVQFRPGG